jgi:general secretion pathway protein G
MSQELPFSPPESRATPALDLRVVATRTRGVDPRLQGMTLIEIMIVVVIMALVATGVGLAVLPALEKAKVKQTETAIQAVRQAVAMYRATNNSDCATMPQLLDDKVIEKGTSTKDAWDHEFDIQCDGSDVIVRSAGKDGQFETEDDLPAKK